MSVHPGKGPLVRVNAEAGADFIKKRRREDLPKSNRMNHSITRGAPRAKLSLRYGAIHAQALAGKSHMATNIPTPELQRLVATMVD